jgi:soluble lytic murein transglycosylase-like protein
MTPAVALLLATAGVIAPAAADVVAADPQPATAVLLAARAEVAAGAPAAALDRLTGGLPRAGELGAALRLEAASLAVALGRDPWPLLAPLFDRAAPAAHRRAATAAVRDAAGQLPLPLAAGLLQRPLSRALRRQVRAALAIRRGDDAAVAALLAERDDDRAAREAAAWLAGREIGSIATRLDVASALLAGGLWREADRLLAVEPAPLTPAQRSRFAFLRGRAAYRLDRLEEARGHYDRALETAPAGEPRFAAAVQRARTAELLGELAAARADWDAARAAAHHEVEGWDGGARTRVLLGRNDEAAALLARAPVKVRRVAGPRLAALLLARGDHTAARALLGTLPHSLAVVRVLEIAARSVGGADDAVRQSVAALLADSGAGAWRDLVLASLPALAPPADPAAPAREPAALAALAMHAGTPAARAALAAALTADPAWSPLLAGAPAEPVGWTGPAAELAAAGLWREAASLYPHRFPSATPAELAWSAHALARSANGPAALAAGEQLAQRLGGLPATLLPDRLLGHVVPTELTVPCRAAAAGTAVPPSWLAAVVRRESRFDPAARSAAGALGLAQFVPEAARRLGTDEDALWDGDASLALATRELARLRERFGPRLDAVAAAYNAGDRVVAAWNDWLGTALSPALFAAAVPYRETAAYVVAVGEGQALTRDLDAAGVP